MPRQKRFTPLRATETGYRCSRCKFEKELATDAERERFRCETLVRSYLLFQSQRAVGWHEVQDCLEAINSPHADVCCPQCGYM